MSTLPLPNPHPACRLIQDLQLGYDRSFFKNYPGARVLVRFSPNGEVPFETPPGTLLQVVNLRPGGGARYKMSVPYFICINPLSENTLPFPTIAAGPLSGYIYIVKRRDEFKIGMTKNLGERLSSLQVSHKIEGLVHYILTDNPKRLEKILHRRFAEWRMSGEWFRLQPDHLDELSIIGAVLVDHDEFTSSVDDEPEYVYDLSLGLSCLPALPPIKFAGHPTYPHFPIITPAQWPVDWAKEPSR